MRWKLLSVSLLLSLLSSPLSSACYFCLIEKNLTDTLCTGYKLPEPSVQSYEECFNSVRRVFLDDRSVAAAGRVGRGYEEQLKTILNRLIAEVISVTRGVVSTGRGYEEQLKAILNRLIAEVISVTRGVVSTVNRYTYLLTTAADQFKSEAWKLPRGEAVLSFLNLGIFL
ncbi:UNVERIFIED_CONTAM: hypothetical protein FKN15_018971 [Acipenser sinensis]